MQLCETESILSLLERSTDNVSMERENGIYRAQDTESWPETFCFLDLETESH